MAASKSVTASGNATSDAFTTNTASSSKLVVERYVILKADNDGTPASGDTVDLYLLTEIGDPDADPDSADEFTTAGHGLFLYQLDTNTEDPSISPVVAIPSAVTAKLYAVNNSSVRAITVSAQMLEVDEDGGQTLTQITWT